jgi:hypothetical protein
MAEAKGTPGIDLEDEEEGTSTPTETTTKPKGSAAGTGPVSSDDDVDFGEEDNYRRPGELEVLKVTEKNTFARFSVLPNPGNNGKAFMKRSYVHYVQGKGYARCHTKRDKKGMPTDGIAFCCKLKEAEARYSALIVQYTSVDPKTGRFLKDRAVEFELKCVCLSRIGYKDVSLLPGVDENTDQPIAVTAVDITGTPKEDTKGLKFTKISAKASWTKNPDLKVAVEKAMQPFLDGRELHRKGGKELSVPEMKAHLGIGGGSDDSGPGMDDLD